MKCFIRTMVVALLLTLTIPSAAQAQTYDVDYQSQTIEQVAKDLRKKTGYQFVYKKDIVENVGTITCHYKNATLQQILNRVFYEHAGLDYEISKGTVILKKADNDRPFFKRNIVGAVLDKEGEPLPGATVNIVGTDNTVVTDIDGSFTILMEGKDPVIEVSFVGMKTKRINVNRATKHNFLIVEMDPDANLLNEVLVTGYQNIKRENATGSYQVISAKELDERYTTDLVSRLEGQIPGLTIYDNGSNDGGESAMTIRGVSSFRAKTSPLVVVDGLPIEGSIESVNPYDIASITVLKDASAAAIYGARASNGVIVITTKRANREKLQVDFNADLTITEKQTYDNLRWANASELLAIEKANFDFCSADTEIYNAMLGDYAKNPARFDLATRLMLERKMGVMSDTDFNAAWNRMQGNDYRSEWRDATLRTQIQHQYNLALRTKGKKLNSNIVFNYKGDNMGVVKEDDNTFHLSYTGDLAATKWLDISVGLNLISERAKTHINDSMRGINGFKPYQSMYNADGTPADMEAGVWLGLPSLKNEELGLKPVTYNLLDELGMNFNMSRRNNIRSFVHANVKLLPELTLSARFQYEDISYKGESYYEAESYHMRMLYNLFTSDGKHYIPDGGMLRSNDQTGDYYTFRTQASYGKTFAEKHAVEAIAGFEYRQARSRYTNNLLLGYDDQTQTNMNHLINFDDLQYVQSSDLGMGYSPLGSAPTEADFSTSETLHRFYSLYATAGYTYDSRYSASFSYRVDKADLFGADPEFRGRPLWSVGASWNIGNEAWMKQYDWIDALKLRASYGQTGNIDQSISSYLTATIAVNDVNGKKGATLNTPPNEQLRWEKTQSWNVGIDFSFFSNRLSGSFDWYLKNSSDLLSLTDIDPTTGWSSLTINNGKARNKGIELQLNGSIIEAKTRDDFGLNAAFNIAYNKNEVVKVDHAPASGYEALRTLHEGDPVNAIYAYRFAGMKTDESGMQSYGWYDSKGNIHTTNIGSGEFSPEDIVCMGGRDPKVTASFVPELTWKGFTLSAMFAYYGGHYMNAAAEDWVYGGNYAGYGNMDIPVPSAFLNYWQAADKTTAIANGYPGMNTIGTSSYIDQTVMHADYMKLRNIVLGYNFSKALCDKLNVNALRLRVQMNNVATWKRNSMGIDPEAVDPLSGYATNAPMRSYTMSVSVNL
ncbi:MAG: SusC/RagA family TonB-linked outer membrane protein [Prevotella sp.]